MKKAGLIKSRRGPQGGYTLARKPEEITVCQVLMAAEGDLTLVSCARDDVPEKGKCEFDSRCVTQWVWTEASRQMREFFDSITLNVITSYSIHYTKLYEVESLFSPVVSDQTVFLTLGFL